MKTIEELLVECSDPYTREEFDRDRARLLARISTKHGIAESEVDQLIAEHRYVHSAEDPEDEYIQVMAMGRAAGWAPTEFVVYGWDGLSRFDASMLVTAEGHAQAAEIFMQTYPFNPRFWEPHQLKIECLDRSDLKIFTVKSLDPLVIEPAP